jgi:hypothetical protein
MFLTVPPLRHSCSFNQGNLTENKVSAKWTSSLKQWVENSPTNICIFIAYICKQCTVPHGTTLMTDVNADVAGC